jgi:hypothetical protein
LRDRQEVKSYSIIDLHKAEPPDRAADVAGVYFSLRPQAAEALGGERDSPSLAKC